MNAETINQLVAKTLDTIRPYINSEDDAFLFLDKLDEIMSIEFTGVNNA